MAEALPTNTKLVESWARRINASWQKSVTGILDTATLIMQALVEVTQDELAPHLILSVPTISKLRAIANDERLQLSHAKARLPASWNNIYELTRLDEAQWALAETGGGKGGLPILRPDVERNEILNFRNLRPRTPFVETPRIPAGTFSVIYADPPWRYEHVKTESRAIENQYPTMTLDEICALRIQDLAHEDCVLFLWATSPKLAEAMRVLESWGFVYRTCAVWDKQKIGMGYYFRQQHELLLVATRGNPSTPNPTDRVSSVIVAPRGEHSKKPPIMYEVIEQMYPGAARVELFCRETREGWAAWGNEVA